MIRPTMLSQSHDVEHRSKATRRLCPLVDGLFQDHGISERHTLSAGPYLGETGDRNAILTYLFTYSSSVSRPALFRWRIQRVYR
jgi:hypothetical protein